METQELKNMINTIYTPMDLNFIAENIKRDEEKYIKILFDTMLNSLRITLQDEEYTASFEHFKKAIKELAK